MNQDVKRQSIKQAKQEKEEKENKILTGIIDSESKNYTFEKTLTMLGEKKTGTFTAHYMGIAARLRVGTIRAKLLDGAPSQSLDTLTDDIAYMMAYLSVALTKKPVWFDLEQMDDVKELREMYMEVYEFVQTFRSRNAGDTNVGDSSDTTGEETVETE